MSETNLNTSYDDGDTNDFQGSPSTSRASSPGGASPPPSFSVSRIPPYSPTFPSSDAFNPHIKLEPPTEDHPLDNRFPNQNFFSNFLEQKFHADDTTKPNTVQKPVPLFSPHLPAFLREKLEAAVTHPSAIYPGFPGHTAIFSGPPSFPLPGREHDSLLKFRTSGEDAATTNRASDRADRATDDMKEDSSD